MTVFISQHRLTHLERVRRRERLQGWLMVLALVLVLGIVGGLSAPGREAVENCRPDSPPPVSELLDIDLNIKEQHPAGDVEAVAAGCGKS